MEVNRGIFWLVLFPGIAEGSHSAPTNVRLHERPAGALYKRDWRSDQKERRATNAARTYIPGLSLFMRILRRLLMNPLPT